MRLYFAIVHRARLKAFGQHVDRIADSLLDQELLPVRMINEFVYCPRLFWIEYVDREFVASHDTLDGERVHRNVDQKSGALPELTDSVEATAGQGEARSISIASEELGLVGVIDFVEFNLGKVIPVDYKRGSIPDMPGNVYAPERIQVILQAMLLRGEGYTCDEAHIDFARSRRHVAIPIDDEAIADGYAALAAAREQLKRNHMPPPLINSPKCGRCSLASICLPDEVAALQHGIEPTVRQFLAPADDRDPLYVMTHGASLALFGETLVVKIDKSIVQQMPLRAISHICIIGNAQISTQALRGLFTENIPVFYFSFGAKLSGYAFPSGSHSLDLRIAQHRLIANEPERCLTFARAFITGKIKNQRTLIRRSLPEEDVTLKRLALLIKRVESADTSLELLGLEGSAASEYFSALAKMITLGESFDFHGRNRRPPKDPVNAVLSFA